MSDSSTPNDGFDQYTADPKNGFDPYEFHIRATNGRGQDKTLRVVSVPPEAAVAISDLVDHPSTPYRNKADFFRDSIILNLNWRKRQMNDPSLSNKVDVFTRAAMAEKELSETAASITLVERRTLQLKEERDPARIAEILLRCRADMTVMENAHYRQEMEFLIQRYETTR